MAKATSKTSKKRSSSKKNLGLVGRVNPLKNFKVAIFMIIFVGLGTYLLIRSFAASGILLGVDNLDISKSSRASVVTEKRPGTDNDIKIVKLEAGTKTNPSKAVFISNTANLDPGQYKTCAIGYAPEAEITGLMSVSQYNNGPMGTTETHRFRLPHAYDYATFRCFGLTVSTTTPGMQVTITNTAASSMRISLIFIRYTGAASAPTVILTATPSTVTKGLTSTLTWESTNTTSCSASGAWSGPKATSGSTTTGAINSDSTYTLTCKGSGGSTRESTTVKVSDVPPPPTPSGFVGVGVYNINDLSDIVSKGIKDIRVENPAGTKVGSPSTSWYKAAVVNGLTILPQLNYNYWSDIGGGGDGHNGVPTQYADIWAKRQVDLIYGAVKASGAPTPEALEVYNEPWNCAFWRSPNDLSQRAAAYLTLVKATTNYAWQQPGWDKVKILVASDTIDSACSGKTWREHLLAADTSGFLNNDLIHPTVHPYVQGHSPNDTNIANNHCYWDFTRYDCAYSDYRAHGSANPTIWATEYGWSTKLVSMNQQAGYTTTALSKMQASGIVDKSYSWLYASGSLTSFGENWLDSSNNCKTVCSSVQDYISSH